MALSSSRPKGGIVFDLDGTLVDSAPDILAALNKTLGDFGRAPADIPTLRNWLGDGASKLLARAFGRQGGMPEQVEPSAVIEVFRSHYSGHALDQTTLYPHARETLLALRAEGYLLGVCTNKMEGMAREILAGLGIDGCFAAILGGDSLPVCKPDPTHILKTLDAMGAEASRGLMVGDTANDVNAARGAKIPVLVTSFGYAPKPAPEMGGDAVLEDFADLPRLVARFLAPDR